MELTGYTGVLIFYGPNLCHSVVLFHNDGSASYPLAEKVHVTGLEKAAELFKALGSH